MIEEGRNFWTNRQGDFDAEAVRRLGFPCEGDFLERIDGNIHANRMRLIIASDEIPTELSQIIEFLNEASEFDIYGIEVTLFTGKSKGQRILAPRLVGLTESSRERKGTHNRSRWTYEKFTSVVSENYSSEELRLIDDLIRFGKEVSGRDIEWGNGKDRGSFTSRLLIDSQRFSLFSVYTTRQFSTNIGWAYGNNPDLDIRVSERYRSRVSNDLGIQYDRGSWEHGWPMAPLSILSERKVAFEQLITDYVSEMKACGPS